MKELCCCTLFRHASLLWLASETTVFCIDLVFNSLFPTSCYGCYVSSCVKRTMFVGLIPYTVFVLIAILYFVLGTSDLNKGW